MSTLLQVLKLWPNKAEAQQACHMFLMHTKTNKNLTFDECSDGYVFSTHTATNTMCIYAILKAYHYETRKDENDHNWYNHYEATLKEVASGITKKSFHFLRNFGDKKMKLIEDFFMYHGYELKQ